MGFCDDRVVSPPALESALPVRAHHLPAAGFAAGAVALLVMLPEVLGDLGRLAAVIVLQLGLVLVWMPVATTQASTRPSCRTSTAASRPTSPTSAGSVTSIVTATAASPAAGRWCPRAGPVRSAAGVTR